MEAHGQLLKFHVTRYIEYRTGTGDRIAPAFSQVAVKDIIEDEDNSWQNIDAEFETAGFNLEVVRRNRGFIRDWIRTAIPDDGGKEIAGAGSRIVGDGDTPKLPYLGNIPIAGPCEARVSGPQHISEPAKESEEGATQEPAISQDIPHAASSSSHRSQFSSWRDMSFDGTALAIDMISKVLRSKYGDDCDDLCLLPIKRAYYHLDWTNRGWISHEEVEHCCKEAAIKAGFHFRTTGIIELVGIMDKNQDHEISCEELIETVMELKQEVLRKIIHDSQLAGRLDCGLIIKK